MGTDATLMVRGRWRCESRIATLATNTVWRAHDQLLDRPVAIRIFHPELLLDPQARERLEEAFVVAARLEHDNISCVYDAFDDDLGLVLVSELVVGPTLGELTAELAPVPDEVAAAIGVQLANGAAAASTAGLTHRELSPEHVRVTYDGTVKILGLGSARPLADIDATPMTVDDRDWAYLAPEQLAGGRSDERTDIYSIGLMLWELAAGRQAPDDLDVRRRSDVPSVRATRPAVSARLAAIIERCTRCRAEDRWGDAQQLAASLLRECTARPKRLVFELAAPLLADPPAPIGTLRSQLDREAEDPGRFDHETAGSAEEVDGRT